MSNRKHDFVLIYMNIPRAIHEKLHVSAAAGARKLTMEVTERLRRSLAEEPVLMPRKREKQP